MQKCLLLSILCINLGIHAASTAVVAQEKATKLQLLSSATRDNKIRALHRVAHHIGANPYLFALFLAKEPLCASFMRKAYGLPTDDHGLDTDALIEHMLKASLPEKDETELFWILKDCYKDDTADVNEVLTSAKIVKYAFSGRIHPVTYRRHFSYSPRIHTEDIEWAIDKAFKNNPQLAATINAHLSVIGFRDFNFGQKLYGKR